MMTGRDFGLWRFGRGQRYLLHWEPDGRLLFDGDPIGWIGTEEEAVETLAGYEDNCDREDALAWLASRLNALSSGWSRYA